MIVFFKEKYFSKRRGWNQLEGNLSNRIKGKEEGNVCTFNISDLLSVLAGEVEINLCSCGVQDNWGISLHTSRGI